MYNAKAAQGDTRPTTTLRLNVVARGSLRHAAEDASSEARSESRKRQRSTRASITSSSSWSNLQVVSQLRRGDQPYLGRLWPWGHGPARA